MFRKEWLIDYDTYKNLGEACIKFIEKHDISCPEVIYQTDKVALNALEFIEGICNVVGYAGEDSDVFEEIEEDDEEDFDDGA